MATFRVWASLRQKLNSSGEWREIRIWRRLPREAPFRNIRHEPQRLGLFSLSCRSHVSRLAGDLWAENKTAALSRCRAAWLTLQQSERVED